MRGDLPSGRWGLHGGIGGMFPFTGGWGVSLISCAVNGIRGAAALPLSIPAAPRGNRCCALRSPPACLTAAGSTRLTRSILELVPVSVRLCPPSMASRPCHSRFGSPISAGVNTVAVRWMSNEKQSLLEPRRPDKRSRAIRHYSRHAIAGWRLRLIRPGDCRGYSGAPPSPWAEGHFQPRTSGKSSPCSRT